MRARMEMTMNGMLRLRPIFVPTVSWTRDNIWMGESCSRCRCTAAGLNSLAPGKFDWNFPHVIFKQILVIDGSGISCEIALLWMSLDISLMISQHWFRQWLGAVRQQAITWSNIDSDLCRHLASLGPHELITRPGDRWSNAFPLEWGIRRLENERMDQWVNQPHENRDSWVLFLPIMLSIWCAPWTGYIMF